jgi:nucleoside-diphosphate-sugar epimerase
VLVTGAAGFIGLRLVQRLVESGAQVWAGLAPDEAQERVAALPAPVERSVFDLRGARAVRAATKDAAPQIVFHLAAVGVTDPGIDPALALAVNAGGTVHLLEALKGRDVERVVLVGTCYEYGARESVEGLDPFNAYAGRCRYQSRAGRAGFSDDAGRAGAGFCFRRGRGRRDGGGRASVGN